jgi:outer membrane protein
MNMKLIKALLVFTTITFTISVKAQEIQRTLPELQQNNTGWSLDKCISYARENNIQIKTKQLTKELADVETNSAKAQRYPTLSFSTNHSVSFQNSTTYNDYNEASDKTNYSGNYNLNSGLTLYSGNKITNTVKQQTLLGKASEYNLLQSIMDVEISITQAYLQILYNKEALQIAQNSSELSQAQVSRGEELVKAGSLSKVDLAQLQSQAASDKYAIVKAENTLNSSIISLKQLLELGLTDKFSVNYPNIKESSVLETIPSLEEVYNTAIESNPNILSSRYNTQAAELGVKVAQAQKYPTLSASAGVATGTFSNMNTGYLTQFKDRMNESVGLNLSIPIFNGRSARNAVQKAKIQSYTTKLQEQSANKTLFSTIEALYNDAVSAQSQYISSNEQLISSELSYKYIREQFNAGLKNIIELTTEKNNYASAQSQQLQSKFSAVLALKLLQIYQNKPIEL